MDSGWGWVCGGVEMEREIPRGKLLRCQASGCSGRDDSMKGEKSKRRHSRLLIATPVCSHTLKTQHVMCIWTQKGGMNVQPHSLVRSLFDLRVVTWKVIQEEFCEACIEAYVEDVRGGVQSLGSWRHRD